jgi:hypothetical protein
MNDPGNPSYPETFRKFRHAFFFGRLSPGAGSAMRLRMIIAVLFPPVKQRRKEGEGLQLFSIGLETKHDVELEKHEKW